MIHTMIVDSYCLEDRKLAITNKVSFAVSDVLRIYSKYVEIRILNASNSLSYVYRVGESKYIKNGRVCFNIAQRNQLCLHKNDNVIVQAYADIHAPATDTTIQVAFLNDNLKSTKSYSILELQQAFVEMMLDNIITIGQEYILDYQSTRFTCKIVDIVTSVGPTQRALFQSSTIPHFMTLLDKPCSVRLVHHKEDCIAMDTTMKLTTETLHELGIGGLTDAFSEIFRRAFASRLFASHVIADMGIKHVKGILLYGPPGTGKTLLARHIGQMVGCDNPKIVNGPEVLNKFVGQSEQNIRDLFVDAEEEFLRLGPESKVHVIVFDEIDSICKHRGLSSGSTGVHDSIVTQLLSKIDGINALDNILIIGLTNRKDMIDEALLRPGRLEIHIELSLPTTKGRQEILDIHTRKLRMSKYLADDVDIELLSEDTKNFTGAELEALVKSACSFALSRQVGIDKKTMSTQDSLSTVVCSNDFTQAFTEIEPRYGFCKESIIECIPNGITIFNKEMELLVSMCAENIQKVAKSKKVHLLSYCLEGDNGCGKTSLSAHLAYTTAFPFIRRISADTMLTMSESQKCGHITSMFLDAYRSSLSFIILDDIERLIEYVPQGPRFSNTILQTLLVLIKRHPPKGHKIFILGTTSLLHKLSLLDVHRAFDRIMHIPNVTRKDVSSFNLAWSQEALDEMSVKYLLMSAELDT